MKDLLKKLVETPCVPQFQEKMVDLLQEEVDFAEVETDHLGNVHLGASGEEKISLLANMSEIGFVVEHIEDSGFLRFQNISEVDERTLLSQRMMVYGEEGGGVRGVTGSKPPHLLRGEEKKKEVKIEDMFIDVGAYSREQAEDMGIDLGDPIVLEGWLKKLSDGRLAGKSLGRRSSCAIVIEALRELFEEGVGGVSAWLLSQATSFPKDFSPDYAVSVDPTLAGPYPSEKVQAEQHELPVEIGDGPALTLRENEASINQETRRLIDEAAEKAEVNVQIEANSRAKGTRVNPMQGGIPSAIISPPVKYLNTPGEMMDYQDLEDSTELIEEFCKLSG